MKNIIVAFCITLGISAVSYGASLIVDSNGRIFPFFAPDGTRTTALTVNLSKHDLRGFTAISVMSPGTACQYRFMSLSSLGTRGNYAKTTLGIANTRHILGVNQNSPFLNLSGCFSTTAGSLERQ